MSNSAIPSHSESLQGQTRPGYPRVQTGVPTILSPNLRTSDQGRVSPKSMWFWAEHPENWPCTAAHTLGPVSDSVFEMTRVTRRMAPLSLLGSTVPPISVL